MKLEIQELEVFEKLRSPAAVQAYLDDIPYSAEERYRCPRSVVRDHLAHCFDGALFAAAALRRLGHKPLIVDMIAERDDDHILALFRQHGCWGAVAKSNFTGLRFREPVYRSLRELVMSYFEQFYNVERERTLRAYTLPLDLSCFDEHDWTSRDEPLEAIALRLDTLRRVPVITPAMVAAFSPVDARSYDAGLLGANSAGLYRPNSR